MKYKVDTLVPEKDWDKSDEEVEFDIKNTYRNNIFRLVGKGNDCYLCFNYALNDNDLWTIEDALHNLYNNYKNIGISQAEKGDIITYEDDSEILHFAKIYKTKGFLRSTIIRSKWGGCGVYETDLYAVPMSYGNRIRIWREK